MKASESCMYRFLDGADKKFIIPVYQRPYSWKNLIVKSYLMI